MQSKTDLIKSVTHKTAIGKSEIVRIVAKDATLTLTSAAEAVDAVFNAIRDSLATGNEVKIVGFGTFKATHREPSTARNMRTGTPMTVPAMNVARFSAGRPLKAALNPAPEIERRVPRRA